MKKYTCLLLLPLFVQTVIAQSLPPVADSLLNSLKVKKLLTRDIEVKHLDIAPAHIDANSIKFYHEPFTLFSFKRQTVAAKAKDSSLMKKNPFYLHYALGQSGNKRAYYYKGKFETLALHHSFLERQQLGLDTCFIYFDTAMLVATRNYRYLFTQWQPAHPDDTAYHSLNVVFIFNKNNKLVKQLSYDNYYLDLKTSVGYFNRDELLDIVFYEKTKTGQWQLVLYSLDKKGKFIKADFYVRKRR